MVVPCQNRPTPGFRQPPPAPAGEAEWTVLVYTSSSPDLEAATAAGLEEMCQRLGGTVPVAVQWGRGGRAERLQAEAGQLKPLQQLDSLDMSQSASLGDFLKWGMQRYPSRHYAVVVGGHGAGFLGCVTNSQRTRMMRLPELRQALEAAPRRPDVLALNTCLMSCGEAAAELAGSAPALVASQAAEKGLGMPLGDWIADLQACPDGAAAARSLVEHCAGTPERTAHVSAVDLRQLEPLVGGLHSLAHEVLNHPQSRDALFEDLKSVPGLWDHPQDMALFRQVDVGSLCHRWAQDERLPHSLRQAAHQVKEKADAAVLAQSAPEGAEASGGTAGLSLFTPDQPWESIPLFDKPLGQVYHDLRLAKSTHWDQAMRTVLQETPIRDS